MEGKKYKGNAALQFFKKNIYLILMVVCILAIGTLITLTALNKARNAGGITDTTLNNNNNNTNNNNNNNNTGNTNNDGNTVELMFSLPVEGEVIKGYSDTVLVYNATLKHWSTHQGIDIAGAVGTEVKAIEAGKISSVSTTQLRGTTVTITHENGYQSIYSLLSPTVLVAVGADIEKGTVIGTIAETGIFEIADGPHLHFEMKLNGELVDPALYFEDDDK